MTPPRWLPRFSRIRLAPRIAVVVLLTMAMTLLLDAAIGMALRSTGPRAVDERSLVRQAMQLRADLAGRPRAQRPVAVERAARERKLDFALLDAARRDGAPPLADLVETMRARLAERAPDHDVAYAVSINVLPDGAGRGVRQVTVVVPTPGAERAEILSVAARPFADGSTTMIATVPAEEIADAAGTAPLFSLPLAPVMATPPAPLVAYPWARTRLLPAPTTQPAAASGATAASVQPMAPLQPATLALAAAPTMDLRLSDYAAPSVRAPAQAGDATRIAPAFLEGLRIEPPLPRMSVALELPDGQWLLASPGKPNPLWLQQLFKLAGVMLLLLLVALLSVRTARSFLRPLTELAQAAERLGREREPTPIEGMTIPEYAAIAGKFNEMQMRLKRFVDDRTHQLAAISHDLRTPLTRMRLALEYVDEARRGPLLAEIIQMETMISGSLAFAGEDARLEPHQRVDLAALLISLCDEACDRGDEAAYAGPDHAELPCQPIAMRRAFANLIDNGCRYGVRVRVTLATAAAGLRIDIDDDGPGIAPDLRERAFAPFQRLDNARAMPGSGLGLSIARSVIRGHGGDVVLRDADGGGLRARIELPLPD